MKMIVIDWIFLVVFFEVFMFGMFVKFVCMGKISVWCGVNLYWILLRLILYESIWFIFCYSFKMLG